MEKDASAWFEHLLGVVEQSRSDGTHAADNPAAVTTAFCEWEMKRASGPVGRCARPRTKKQPGTAAKYKMAGRSRAWVKTCFPLFAEARAAIGSWARWAVPS